MFSACQSHLMPFILKLPLIAFDWWRKKVKEASGSILKVMWSARIRERKFTGSVCAAVWRLVRGQWGAALSFMRVNGWRRGLSAPFC